MTTLKGLSIDILVTNFTATFTQNQLEKSKDQYDQLIKLDDLRKKEIISDAEFDVQKKKLLFNDSIR